MGFRVWSLGSRVWGLGFRVLGEELGSREAMGKYIRVYEGGLSDYTGPGFR